MKMEAFSCMIKPCFAGLQGLKILVHVFCATNNMFPNTIVHLTFRAPAIVINTHVDANMYLPMCLLQR